MEIDSSLPSVDDIQQQTKINHNLSKSVSHLAFRHSKSMAYMKTPIHIGVWEGDKVFTLIPKK